MGNKARINLLTLVFLVIVGICFIAYFVSASHTVTLTDGQSWFRPTEDVHYVFNFTISNTEINLVTGNITQVNITLPGTFTFINNTGTNATETASFTNTSSMLMWINSTGLIVNVSNAFFWFNASASTPGNYTINISTQNSTSIMNTSLVVVVNDTTAPDTLNFVTPTSDNGSTLSQNFITLNISATDNFNLNKIRIYLWNTTAMINNTNVSVLGTTNSTFLNITGLVEGIYYLNATVNDTSNYNLTSETRTITLDTTKPFIKLISPMNSSISTMTSWGFEYNVSDNSLTNCSLLLDNSPINFNSSVNISGGTNIFLNSSSVGNHFWAINCTDRANNNNQSEAWNFTISGTPSSSSGGGTIKGVSDWKATYPVSDAQFKEGYTRGLLAKQRLMLKVNGSVHYVGVISITNTTAIINASSAPQQVTLSVGDTKKFDVTNDNYYDISVTLKSIATSKAEVTVQAIYEKIVVAKTIEEEQKETAAEAEFTGTGQATSGTESGTGIKWWIVIAIIVVIVAIVAFFVFNRKKRRAFFGY